MNSVISNNLSLKYQRLTPSGCKDLGIGKFEFLAMAQFLLHNVITANLNFKILKFLKF